MSDYFNARETDELHIHRTVKRRCEIESVASHYFSLKQEFKMTYSAHS